MSYADSFLMLARRGYTHSTSIIAFSATHTQFAVTSATKFTASPSGAAAIASFDGVCRFACVYNDDPTNFLTVAVGSTVNAPEAATAGHDRVYPRSFMFFQLEQDGTPILDIKADTSAANGALIWYK